MNIKDKIIIITGGSGLIGKSVLNDLRKSGAISINLDVVSDDGLSNFFLKCDITSTNEVDKSITKILKKFNKIDGLINNAYPRTKDWSNLFENIELNSWVKNIDLQLNSLFYFNQKIIKIMMNQKHGSIVNVGSIYGSLAPDFSLYKGLDMTMPAAYSAIKGGVINFTKYLASYSGQNGIRVNTVSPGGILDSQNINFIKRYSKKVPLGRMGNSFEISPAIIFLLSDSSSYITGQNIIIDGGYSIT